MIGIILMIIWIVSALFLIGATIYYIYDTRPKSTEEELNELAEMCRKYIEEHPEWLRKR